VQRFPALDSVALDEALGLPVGGSGHRVGDRRPAAGPSARIWLFADAETTKLPIRHLLEDLRWSERL